MLDRAADQLAAIVYAERARLSRQEPKVKRVVEAFTSERQMTILIERSYLSREEEQS